MKFDITIKDATLEDMSRLVDVLGGNDVKVTDRPVVETTEHETPVADAILKPKVAPKLEKPLAPDVDADGTPWDDRIHNPNKKLKTDGTWVKKRNVPDEVFEAVLNEITDENGTEQPDFTGFENVAPVQQTAPVQQPVENVTPVQQPVENVAPVQQPVENVAPVQQPVENVAPVQQTVPVQQPNDLGSILGRVQKGCSSGVVPQNYFGLLIQEVNAAANVQMTSITDMVGNQMLLDTAAGILSSKGI